MSVRQFIFAEPKVSRKRHKCPRCAFRAAQKSALTRHMRTHTGVKPYACNKCTYRAAQKSSLTKHMRTHTGVKPYACNKCTYRAAQKSDSHKAHADAHGRQTIRMQQMYVQGSSQEYLTKHMRTHTGVKPYACNKCTYRAAQQSSLTKHMRTHTGVKPYACNKCTYRAAQKSALTKHMRTHTGDDEEEVRGTMKVLRRMSI